MRGWFWLGSNMLGKQPQNAMPSTVTASPQALVLLTAFNAIQAALTDWELRNGLAQTVRAW